MLKLASVVRLLVKWAALLTLVYIVYLMAQFSLHQRIVATSTSAFHGGDDVIVRRRHDGKSLFGNYLKANEEGGGFVGTIKSIILKFFISSNCLQLRGYIMSRGIYSTPCILSRHDI